MDVAGVFIDGRYRTQVKAQVADVYTPVPWPDVTLTAWLKEQLPQGGRVGFDPWLHAAGQIRTATGELKGSGIELVPCDNLVDRIWQDQPPPPMEAVKAHPMEFAGESAPDKAARLAEDVTVACLEYFGPGARLDHPLLGKLARDARGVEFMEGASNVQKLIVSQDLIRRGRPT